MQASKSQMQKVARLRKRPDYLRVQGAGRKWVSTSLIVQTAPGSNPDSPSFGITVSKKASPASVRRNRIKRRLRALAYDVLPEGALPGTDYVLVGRAETLNKSYAELRRDFIWCLKKLSLWREPGA
jgi:ribonuclease P protein component